jgi:hypothetical protein
MSETQESIYRICVRGRLGQTGAAWFEGFTFGVDETKRPPQTYLEGTMDQAALHGLLSRIRDLGLTLVSVQCMDEWRIS